MPYITNFTPKAYGGDPQNWVSVQDARGLIYVANHKQILEYDGVTWNHLASEPDTDFFSLAIDSTGMLFAGAVGNLGYLAPDEVGRLHFVSLLDQIPERYRDFDHVWKIIALPEGVYFQSHKYLFRWDGRRFDVWEAETRFEQALTVGPSIYLRREGTGLMQVVGDSLRLVPQGERFADDRVYVMLRYAEDTLLVGARNQGLFLYDGRSFTPFPTPADAWLNEAQLYCGVVLGGGSRFALGTLQGGLLIIDREGNPVQVLDKESGLLDQQIHYIQTDREGALWLSFNIGLARVDLAAPYTLFDETNGLTGTVNVVLRHQGRVHASTSQGVFYLDGTTQHPGVPAPNPSFQRLAQPDVYTLALLPVDETLMATTAEGVHLLRNGGHRLLETAWIWPVALYRSRFHPERIYVGLSDGLAVLERDGEAWIDQGQVPEIRGDVRSFAEEDAQTLWVGTDKRGAWRIASGEIQHFEASANLPAGAVSVHYAGEHVLFATAKGLRRFDTATGQFLPDTRFGAIFADTLRSIQNIVEASDGVVYVQSVINDHPELHRAIPAGTDTYDHEKVPIPTLADGDLVYYIRPEADGTVWFGGTNGLVRYRSGRSPLKRQPIPAFIRQVSTTRHDSVIFAGVTPASSPPWSSRFWTTPCALALPLPISEKQQ